METIQLIAITMGVAWASGINLYAAVFMLGFLGGNGYVELPPGLEVLTDPLVIFSAGLMYCMEFFIDKIPGLDSAWDTVHTFIRIPAAAVLAMGAVGEVAPAVQLAAFLLGGTLAAGSHAMKTGSLLVINTSPEPVTNWTASITEDLLVIAGIWTALNHPWLFLAALAIFILLLIWLLPGIWHTVTVVFGRLTNLFRKQQPVVVPEPRSAGPGTGHGTNNEQLSG